MSANTESGNSWIARYSKEEKETKQIRKVFDLLVKEHLHYDLLREEEGFGFARKSQNDQVVEIKKTIKIKQVLVTKEMLRKMVQK